MASKPITIDLPLPLDCLHPNARPHFRVKAKATAQCRTLAQLIARPLAPREPLVKACYKLVFRLPRKRDYDGLLSWCKAYIDGLADAGIIVNDSEFRPIGIERLSGAKETGGQHGVTFIIWPDDNSALVAR